MNDKEVWRRWQWRRLAWGGGGGRVSDIASTLLTARSAYGSSCCALCFLPGKYGWNINCDAISAYRRFVWRSGGACYVSVTPPPPPPAIIGLKTSPNQNHCISFIVRYILQWGTAWYLQEYSSVCYSAGAPVCRNSRMKSFFSLHFRWNLRFLPFGISSRSVSRCQTTVWQGICLIGCHVLIQELG